MILPYCVADEADDHSLRQKAAWIERDGDLAAINRNWFFDFNALDFYIRDLLTLERRDYEPESFEPKYSWPEPRTLLDEAQDQLELLRDLIEAQLLDLNHPNLKTIVNEDLPLKRLGTVRAEIVELGRRASID